MGHHALIVQLYLKGVMLVKLPIVYVPHFHSMLWGIIPPDAHCIGEFEDWETLDSYKPIESYSAIEEELGATLVKDFGDEDIFEVPDDAVILGHPVSEIEFVLLSELEDFAQIWLKKWNELEHSEPQDEDVYEFSSAKDGIMTMLKLGFKYPTVDELCKRYGTKPNQFRHPEIKAYFGVEDDGITPSWMCQCPDIDK